MGICNRRREQSIWAALLRYKMRTRIIEYNCQGLNYVIGEEKVVE